MSKLLLVEDDNNLREIYEARLQAEGYTIVTAKDGEEALAVAKAEKPDLIVSDVMMPKISGFEMLDILKNTDGLKNVKVIMLTALGQSDDQQRADTLGADRYLVKSQVTLEDIVRVAHELLEDGAPAPTAAPPAATPAPAVAPEPVNPVSAAPAVAPEPTQVTPAPEPVAAPPVAAEPPATTDQASAATTTAAPEPVVASDAASASASEAKSTSEESADLKDQIEDIIEGATTDAPAPAEPASAAPEPVATAPDAVAAPEQTTEASDNEKVMNDAVNSLTNTPVATEPEPAATPEAPAATPAAEPVEPTVAPPDDEDKTDTPSPNSGGSTMSHEKVIQPPADSQVEKKPDIQALFAAEQAKEASSQAGGVVQPQTPATPTDGTDKPVDPNSIAL